MPLRDPCLSPLTKVLCDDPQHIKSQIYQAFYVSMTLLWSAIITNKPVLLNLKSVWTVTWAHGSYSCFRNSRNLVSYQIKSQICVFPALCFTVAHSWLMMLMLFSKVWHWYSQFLYPKETKTAGLKQPQNTFFPHLHLQSNAHHSLLKYRWKNTQRFSPDRDKLKWGTLHRYCDRLTVRITTLRILPHY